jgi:hypothetical protein
MTNGGSAHFTAGTGTADSVTISNYTMFLEWGWETNRLKAGTITIQNGGTIMHAWNTATTTNGSGGWDPNGGVFIECSNLTVQTGGQIYADGLGYGSVYGADGYGPGRGTHGGTTLGNGGGGGYGGGGGNGYNGVGGSTYGSSNNPASPGSGGAGSDWGTGGSGGGFIQIVASGALQVNGYITANASTGPHNYDGGGSGGGINIRCGSLIGNGIIRADGSNRGTSGPGGYGGGGGGGRIAIYVFNAPLYTGGNVWRTPTVNFGTGLNDGSAGTIYFSYKPRGTMWSTW